LLPAGFAITTAKITAAAAAWSTTTATTTASATEAVSATTAAAARAWLARLSFIYLQSASANFLAIELTDGGFAFFFTRHFDETKPA
jgi:hypothetical protein